MKGTGLRMGLRTDTRLAMFGRMRMAEWIEMPERDFAAEVEKIEKDPLFRKLYFGSERTPGVIRRQRWPQGRFSGGFYDFNEQTLAGGERVKVEEKLGEKARLLPVIRKMGREAFERYFLYATEPLPLSEIARRTGISEDDARAVNDLLLEIGAEAEFAAPPGRAMGGGSYACLARLSVEGGEPAFEFFSPYWARGLYQIRYDLLEDWKSGGRLAGLELKRLPHLLKRMETVNLRQNTVFRILESLAKLHKEFLDSHRPELKRPISLRALARRLDLAPSTVSRAASGRSVKLPWGVEVPLIDLLPGRRRILREVLSKWLAAEPRVTDAALAERLREEHGIKISRRTVNAVRHELKIGEES